MADSTIFGLTQETVMTAAARLAVQETASSTRTTSATFALLGGFEVKTSSVTTGDVSPAAGEFHWLDVSGMTANRAFVLPVAASIQTGERCGFGLSVGDATLEFEIKSGAAGDLINGVDHSSTIFTQCFITGEVMIFRCIDGSTGDWVVEYDGRIACTARMDDEGGTAFTTTETSPDFDAAAYDVGGITNLTSNRFKFRRDGNYIMAFFHMTQLTIDDNNWVQVKISLNPDGANTEILNMRGNSSGSNRRVTVFAVGQRAFADGDDVGVGIDLESSNSDYTSSGVESLRPQFIVHEVFQ